MESEIKAILSQPKDSLRHFQVDNSSYLFNIKNMRLCQVDRNLLKEKAKPYYLFSEFDDEFINTLEARSSSKNKAQYEGYNAIIEVTKNCNLGCVYCYRQNDLENKNLDPETANQIVKYIKEVDQKREIKGDSIRLIFFGGEPLLKFDIVQFIVTKLKNNIHNYKLKFSISTNGTVLTKSKLKFLEENNFNVQVSFEGEEDIQNMARPFKTGNGSFNTILKNISLINSNFKDKITIGISFSKLKYNISPTIKKFIDLGFTTFNVLFVTDDILGINKIDINDKEILKKEIENIYNLYESEIIKGNKVVIHPLTEILTKLYTRIPEGKCNSTINVEAFNSEGKISPCQRFLSNSEFFYGTVSEGINIEQIRNIRDNHVNYSELCENCWLYKMCSGKCVFRSSLPDDSSDHVGCYIKHLLWEAAVKSFIKIIVKNEDKFDNHMKNYLIKQRLPYQ
ncbi:MAG: radical SAM protein [Bacteroidia bacterium]|nr:radical SAM protein [Bacteroidia bacterium]